MKVGLEGAVRTAELLLSRKGIFRPRDFDAAGVPHSWVDVLSCIGPAKRVAPGVLASRWRVYPLSVRAAVKWPRAVIGGPSALHLHCLCEEPERLWLFIDAHARAPRAVVPVRVGRCRSLAADPDVETVVFGGVTVRLFSVARSFLEALRSHEDTPPDLMRFALTQALNRGRTTLESVLARARQRRCLEEVRSGLLALGW